jgi:ABC-type microcin C transport system permease subunit YejE
MMSEFRHAVEMICNARRAIGAISLTVRPTPPSKLRPTTVSPDRTLISICVGVVESAKEVTTMVFGFRNSVLFGVKTR